jgi:hypothetical protein
MPGSVVEHNADEVRNDGSLVWNIPLTGSIDVFAESNTGSGTSAWVWWVLLGVLTIGIIAGIAAVILSRNDSKKAVAEAAEAHETSSADVPPPPSPSALTSGDAGEAPALKPSDDPETPALEPSDDKETPALESGNDEDAS